MKWIFGILINILVTVLFYANGYPLTGKEIIEKSENVIRGDTRVGVMTITVKTRRWTRSMKLKMWDFRLSKKSFGEIFEPKKDAGNRFLMINKTLRHYVPSLQKDILISPSMMLQSWMGSDFTNDDIVKESSIVDDYTHTIEAKDRIDGNECYRIMLAPKSDAAVIWGKIIYYVRIGDYLPVRQEFYNEHGVMKKLMTFGGFKNMHDRVIPTMIKMQTMSTPDRYTVLKIDTIRFNEKIPEKIFSIQNLSRR
jgi:outer membrane lipoprotein-sorting protein